MYFPRIWHREINFAIEGLRKVGINVIVFDKSRIENSLKKKLIVFLAKLNDFIMDINTDFSKYILVMRSKEPLCRYSSHSGRVVINLAMLDFNNPEQKESIRQTIAQAKKIESLARDIFKEN